MKRNWLFSMVTILLISCISLFPTSTSVPTTTFEPPNTLPDTTDPSQPITVQAGETFEIVLASNSSTGYRWKLVGELDANVVQLVGQDYIAQRPIMPGSGGVDIWTFRAVNAGDTTIVIGYYPPSQEGEPQETATFSIQVE